MHQAGVVERSTRFSFDLIYMAYFITEHCHRRIRIFNGEHSAKTAALFSFGQLYQIQTAHISNSFGEASPTCSIRSE